MKRLLSYLALAILGPIWRLPAWAQLTTLGVGGIVAAVAVLTPPTVLPQPSALFSQANGWGQVNQALKPNGGSSGAFAFPPTPTDSFTVYQDLVIDPNLGGLPKWALGNGSAAGGEAVSTTNPGAPVFGIQDNVLGAGAHGFNWWNATAGVQPLSSVNQLSLANKGTNYNPALLTWAATGGCPSPSSREPTGIILAGGTNGYAQIGDPGWLCGGTPTINFAAIPGVGAAQTSTAETCAANTPATGQIQVTITVPLSHGIQPGQQFVLAGYTPSGWNGTYAALPGTTSGTLVGTNVGTCPGAVTVHGTAANIAGGGSGGSITIAAPSSTNPFATQYTTGVQTKPGQRVCGAFGELGTDSLFPGATFAYYTDHLGNALVNSPAISPWLNQGTATGINGYTVTGAQTPSTPALTVTSLTGTNITSAIFDASTGLARFSLTNPGLIVGSEFTVSGMTSTAGPGSFNLTYVAVAGTNSSTIVANPLSGPIGLPQASALTGASIATGGSLVSVIMPGMYLTGATGYSVISPFGAFGSTGVGGIGTYGLTATQTTFTFNATIAGNTMTVTGTPTSQLVVGMGVAGAGVTANSIISALGTGTGGPGTYTLSQSSTVSTLTSMTSSGSIGASGSPVAMYAAAPFYYNAIAPSGTAPGGGAATIHTQAQMGDFFNLIGTEAAATANLLGSNAQGWGGNIGNVGMFQGAPFPNANGVLSSSAMTDICTKAHDPQVWAANNGGAWKSLYRLNDPGIWADSSGATFNGYITGASGATATLNVAGSPSTGALVAGQIICGPGLAGGPTGCPTLGGSSGAWTLTWGSSIAANLGSSGSPVAMTAGAFKPALPLGASGFTASIAGSKLNVTAVNNTATVTSGSMAAGSSTMVATAATGTIAQGQCFHDGGVQISESVPLCITGGASPNWTVNSTFYPNGITATALTTTLSALVPGTFVQGAGIITPVQILGYGTANGGVGTYTISNPNGLSIPSEAMTSSGVGAGGAIAPGAALTIDNTGVGTTYPITNATTNTGALNVTGGYSNALLHGDPQHIQIQVSSTPLGDPVAGCSACAWSGVSSEVISGGKWSGSVVGIPAGGPYWIAVRASNGTSYASLPNAVFVGWPLAFYGEGNASAQIQNGFNDQTFFSGLASVIGFQIGGINNNNITNASFIPGLPILGVSPSFVGQVLADRFSVFAGSSAALSDGTMGIVNGVSALTGAPVGLINMGKNGTSFEALFYDNIPQTHTIGVGDGSTTTFSSGLGYGGSAGSASVSTVSGSIATTGVMTITGLVGSYGTGPGWAYLSVGQGVSGTGVPPGAFISGLGTGTGAAGTYTISPPPTSAVASETLTITHNNLEFNAALGYGASINGQIVGSTLTVNSLTNGALAPNMVLSGPGISGSPTITACMTNCGSAPISGSVTNSRWLLSANLGTISAESMTLTPPGGVLWPTNMVQPPLIPVQSPGGTVGAAPIVKIGTFQVLVNGTVMCSDTSTFAYNVQSGPCTGTTANGWVNYVTGAYAVTFSSPPASNVPIIASWTNRMTFDNSNAFEQIGTVGDGSSPTGGAFAAVAAKTGGVGAYVNGEQCFTGWPDNTLNWAHLNNYLFGTQMAALHNAAPNLPMLTTGQWRGSGPIAFYGLFSYGSDLDCEQWHEDAATPSSWSGTVVASGSTAVLTLTSAAVGPMWEAEAIECNPASASCALPFGAEIVSLASGTWGASGSTYNLTVDVGSFSNIASAIPMHNAMLYQGGAFYVGPYNDLAMQQGSAGIGNYAVETGGGIAGALRYGHRLGVIAGAALSGNPQKATQPTVDRNSFTGCDASAGGVSPCFDIGNTYAASHAASWTSGGLFTITGGISAGARPFVPGQSVTCSPTCSAGTLVITSVSLPPTQSTAAGAGQVGQTITFQVAGTMSGSGSGTATAGCWGTAGVGASCIDFAIDINTTGTYGVQAQLNTCGTNNLVGTNVNAPTAATYLFPNGSCVPTGLGSFARGFRIGANQTMDDYQSNGATMGSVYDFGADPDPGSGVYKHSQTFSCNIVAALTSPARGVVQCVHGPNYSSPAAPVLGTWASGTTFASYGDPYANTSYTGGLMGYPGGQSFAFTAGSGYTNGHFGLGGVCGTLVSGGANVPRVPVMGIDIVGGAIVNAYPDYMGNGATATCTFPITFSGTASLTAGGGTNGTLNVTGTPTGNLAPGVVITIGTTPVQTVIVKPVNGSSTLPLGANGAYPVTCATTCVAQASTSFSAGPTAGSGGAVATPTLGPLEGIGGIGTYDTDNNMMGMFLYDNSGATGNPLAGKFAIPQGGQESPGLPVRPWGMRRGSQVSG